MNTSKLRSGSRLALAVLALLSCSAAAAAGVGTQVAGASSGPTLSVTTTRLPSSSQGTPYMAFLSAAGEVGAVHWSVASGSLPTGLGLSSAGEITGVPVGTSSSFVVAVTDSASPPRSATQALSLSVTPTPQISVTADQTV